MARSIIMLVVDVLLYKFHVDFPV